MQSYHDRIELARGKGKYTPRGGMLLLQDMFRHLGLDALLERALGAAGSGRGYMRSFLFKVLVHLIHAGGSHASDVRALRKDCLFPGGRVPTSKTLLAFLHFLGRRPAALERLMDLTVPAFLCDQPAAGPGGVPVHVVDIDETFVECGKRCSRPSHKGRPSLEVTLAIHARTGTVLAVRTDPGNRKPGHGRTDVLAAALRRLGGHGRALVRADAAYYNHATFNWCRDNGADFVVRGHGGSLLDRLTADVAEHEWEPVAGPGARPGTRAVVVLHRPNGCGDDLYLHVFRHHGTDAQGELFDGKFAIATSLDVSPSRLLRLYNRRGEDCENRIKEFRSDLAGGTPPCSDLAGNGAWMVANAFAHNSLMILRRTLLGDGRMRLKGFSLLVYQVSCRLVRTGKKTILKVCGEDYELLLARRQALYRALAP